MLRNEIRYRERIEEAGERVKSERELGAKMMREEVAREAKDKEEREKKDKEEKEILVKESVAVYKTSVSHVRVLFPCLSLMFL